MGGNRLAEVFVAEGGAVVSPAGIESGFASLDYVSGSVEIGLADFEMDDVFALGLKGAGFLQYGEGTFELELVDAGSNFH